MAHEVDEDTHRLHGAVRPDPARRRRPDDAKRTFLFLPAASLFRLANHLCLYSPSRLVLQKLGISAPLPHHHHHHRWDHTSQPTGRRLSLLVRISCAQEITTQPGPTETQSCASLRPKLPAGSSLEQAFHHCSHLPRSPACLVS